MFLMYFTEQPMNAYPEEEARRDGVTVLMFSNKFFDPAAGSRLYNERLAEYILADEVGFDGIMLNEHHNAPYCMQARMPVWSSILAAVTKKAKIVQLGNPLPVSDNPVQIAEEIAMIDMISKGRLVSGIVRGAGTEQLANNVNPAFNRERFEEAHDLLVKTFTTPGPFRWEGNHYQFRVVNPWAVPLQKPHPRIWVPGGLSSDTVIFAARHRYPYIALNTTIEATKKIWELYDKTALESGYIAGPENRGYLLRCHVAETDEKAEANAREFMWMEGEFSGLSHPVWALPAGYLAPSLRRLKLDFGKQPALPHIAGTPKTAIRQLKSIMEQTRPGIFALWCNDGKISHEDSETCIRLMGQEVLPALREIAKELGLTDPFEANAPVSLATSPPHTLRPMQKTGS